MADKQSQAQAIVIAGMHRSGTSALSRTLNLVGCDMASELVGGDSRGNERGHWESQRINELNNEILASAGSRWDDWEAIGPGWYDSPAYVKYFARARAVLELEFGSSCLFVIKDPRFCLLMDLWIKAVESVSAAPLVVMPIRNPLDVAASLQHRDGIDPAIGRLLWLRHVLDAEAGSRGCPRVTVGFDQLLADWRSLVVRIGERLNLSWPNLSTAADIDIGEFLSPGLRHHADQRDVVESPTQGIRWVGDTWEILQRWSIDEERPADLDTLNEIRSSLNDLGPLFGRPLLLGRRAMHNESALEAKVADLSADLNSEKGRSQEKGELIEALNTAVAKGQDEIGWRSDEMERLNQVVARQAEEAERRDTEIKALNEAVAKGQDEIGWRSDEIERLNQVVARQAEEAERRDTEIKALNEAVAEGMEEIQRRSDEIERLNQVVARQAEEAERRDTEIKALNEAVAEGMGEIQRRSDEIERLNQVVARQAEEAERRDTEIKALNEAVAKGQDEIERLNQVVARQAEEAERRDTEIKALNEAVAEGKGEIQWRSDEIERLNQVVARQAEEAERYGAVLESLLRAVNERDRRIAAMLQSSSWQLTAPLRWTKRGLGWLLHKLFRLAQIAGWLGTGQFRKAAQSMLPFYRRHAPAWVGGFIPRRLRHWLRATLHTAAETGPRAG